jgi:hypothetical protein
MKTLLLIITGCLLLIFSYAYVFQEPALASSFAGLKFTSSTREVKEVCSKAGLKVVDEETKRDTTSENRYTTIVFAGAIDKSDYPVKFVETDCSFLNDSLICVLMISERGWYQDEKEEQTQRGVALFNLIAMEQYLAGKFGRQPDKVPETIPIWFLWYEGQLQIWVNMQMLPAYAICYSIIYTGMRGNSK